VGFTPLLESDAPGTYERSAMKEKY